MRFVNVIGALALGASVLALGACGNGGSSSSSGNTAQTAAPAPAATPAPVTLTDAQKKALVAELPASYQSADLSNGEAKFAVCRSCHTLVQGGDDMTGPNLYGVFGRKAGGKAGFAYSDDLKKGAWTWDADQLDKWITNPRGVAPGTKMTYVGMTNATDRRDLIAFLKVMTSPPPKS